MIIILIELVSEGYKYSRVSKNTRAEARVCPQYLSWLA